LAGKEISKRPSWTGTSPPRLPTLAPPYIEASLLKYRGVAVEELAPFAAWQPPPIGLNHVLLEDTVVEARHHQQFV
jgi:hypothetical protein